MSHASLKFLRRRRRRRRRPCRHSEQDVIGSDARSPAAGHLERVGTEQVTGRARGRAQQAERMVSELLVMRRRMVMMVMVVIVSAAAATAAAVHLVRRRIVTGPVATSATSAAAATAAAATSATSALLLELMVQLRVVLALAQQPFVVVHSLRLFRHLYGCKTKNQCPKRLDYFRLLESFFFFFILVINTRMSNGPKTRCISNTDLDYHQIT